MEYILFPSLSKQNLAFTIPVKLLLSKTSVSSMLLNTIVLSKMKISCDLSLYSFPMSVFTAYMLVTARSMYPVEIAFPNSKLLYPAAYLTFLLACLIDILNTFAPN